MGHIIPDGEFKDYLRRFYLYIYEKIITSDNPLYALNKIVREVKLTTDGLLFVELDDGSRFYGIQDRTIHRWFKYGKPNKLGKLKEFDYFGDFLNMLYEQYIDRTYEKYRRLKKGDIVVDVGANIGVFTVMAAQQAGSEGMVIAIEPEDKNLKILRRNIEENNLENVVVVPKGLWSREGKLKLYIAPFISHSFMKQDREDFQEVDVDTLENIIQHLGVREPDFIKVDIEGSEVEALKGMEAILRSNVTLAIAAYHPVEGTPTYTTIVPWLEKAGFRTRMVEGIVYASQS